MHWQIQQYVFCDKQQSLEKGEEKQQLEPMVAELLRYFCQHPDQIISRDQLIEQVWLGRVVSDNAVNRVVTKLRKAFHDDAKKPQFIATLPKKGYKFIASVVPYKTSDVSETPLNLTHEISLPSKASNPIRTQHIYVFFGLILLSLLVFWVGKNNNVNQQRPLLVKVEALTRDSGRESAARVSPNQKYLAYTEFKNQKMHLWIKSLDDETRVEVNHGDTSDTWVDSASWSKDSTKIVYLVTTSGRCEYFLREVNGLELGDPKLIHKCPNGSYGKIEFLHSDTRFVYTAAPKPYAPFELFELDIRSGETRKLPQPDLVRGGNSQFDVHPTDNKILISSPNEQLWEGFYSLDLDTDNLELLFEQDDYICCGIWDHSGTRVVLMGEHPAFELVSYDMKGEDPQIIYSGINQLRSPLRHSNGVDYLFVSGHVNQNIHYFNHLNGQSSVLVNDSVDDRIATFSNDTTQLAYIGLSSGNEEVWVSDSKGENKRKLTRFNDSRHFFDLQWFPDDSKLVGLTLNEIHIIDATTGAYERLDLPQSEFKAISVKDDTTIAFSLEIEGQWRLHFYDLLSRKLTIQDEQWQFVRFSINLEDHLWIDRENQVFSGSKESQEPISIDNLKIGELLLGKVFSFQKLGQRLVWQQFDNGKYQLFEQTGNEPTKMLLETDSSHFDLSAEGILYHQVESANADIYTTVAK